MEIPIRKLKSGFEIPVLGIGTWGIGGNWEHDPNNDDNGDIEGIQSSIELGLRHIDTANLYAEGYSEILVGKAIRNFRREEIFITSKISPFELNYKDVILSAKRSLQRLKTDYLDLYLIHFPNPDIPLKSTMPALDYLKSIGLIRNIGVSNFNIKQLEEAQFFSENKIVVNQVQLNLFFREPEKNGIVEYCQKNNTMVMAWKPVQSGMLAKKGIKILDSMCKKYQKTPVQISINWLISQDNVVVISKMKKLEHIKENLGAIGWALSKEDIEILRNEFPDQKNCSETNINSYPF
jgi:diketogulonate reductase-like aldo/keto reductase